MYPYANGSAGVGQVYRYTSSAWGFDVVRFDLQGYSYEPLTVKRATVQGFTLSLCAYYGLLFKAAFGVLGRLP